MHHMNRAQTKQSVEGHSQDKQLQAILELQHFFTLLNGECREDQRASTAMSPKDSQATCNKGCQCRATDTGFVAAVTAGKCIETLADHVCTTQLTGLISSYEDAPP